MYIYIYQVSKNENFKVCSKIKRIPIYFHWCWEFFRVGRGGGGPRLFAPRTMLPDIARYAPIRPDSRTKPYDFTPKSYDFPARVRDRHTIFHDVRHAPNNSGPSSDFVLASGAFAPKSDGRVDKSYGFAAISYGGGRYRAKSYRGTKKGGAGW